MAINKTYTIDTNRIQTWPEFSGYFDITVSLEVNRNMENVYSSNWKIITTTHSMVEEDAGEIYQNLTFSFTLSSESGNSNPARIVFTNDPYDAYYSHTNTGTLSISGYNANTITFAIYINSILYMQEDITLPAAPPRTNWIVYNNCGQRVNFKGPIGLDNERSRSINGSEIILNRVTDSTYLYKRIADQSTSNKIYSLWLGKMLITSEKYTIQPIDNPEALATFSGNTTLEITESEGYTNYTFRTTITGTNIPTPSTAPQFTSPSNNSWHKYDTQLTLKWNSVSGATKYAIQRSIDGGSTWSTLSDNITTLEYIDTTLDKSKIGQVKYRIKAGNAAGASPQWSGLTIYLAGTLTLYVDGSIYSGYNQKWITDWSQSSAQPSKSGSTFAGWWTANSGGTQVTAIRTSDLQQTPDWTLYAHWTQNTRTITLNPNGGKFGSSTSSKTYQVAVGDSFKFQEEPTYTNKVFRGWARSAEATAAVYTTGQTYTPSAADTWYAVWGDESEITFNINKPLINGTTNQYFAVSPTTVAAITKQYGQAINLPTTTLACTGFTFKGWSNGSSTFAPGATYSLEGSVAMQAQWEANNCRYVEIAPSPGPALPEQTQEARTWKFNTTITMPDKWSAQMYDATLWRPHPVAPLNKPFWKVINGTTTFEIDANGTFKFVDQNMANNNNKIQSQWKQITGWREGKLWIYVPEEV